jgi:hypothetical protein
MLDSQETIVEGLWNENVSEDNYAKNQKYQDHLLEQYKVYVEMADRMSQRRNLANTFFLTLHTLILGVAGFVYEKGEIVAHRYVIIIPLLGVLALCYTWWRLVKSYRQLNSAKYKVVGEFEKRLPSSPYWSAEWNALGQGKDPKLYTPLTAVETWVPVIFGLLYIFGAGLLIFGY